MKILVTGVCGQLGHDVMNNLAARGHEGIGSDIQPEYSGAADGTAVTTMPYVSLDITDMLFSVLLRRKSRMQLFTVQLGQLLMQLRMRRIRQRFELLMQAELRILLMHVKPSMLR